MLSICIATLNRAAFIGETLESIIPQLTSETELVVVDGASTDSTESIINEYASRVPNLRYIRLEKNSGVDQDYSTAVERAGGKYCWLMTDDDLLKPGAVDAVLAEVRKGYSVVIVNAEVRGSDLCIVLEEKLLTFEADRIYRPGDDERLFTDVGGYLSFIGALVINKELWMSRDRESYFGSAFVHMGVVFQSALPKGASVLSTPWIMIRYGNAQWRPRAFEIWMFRWPKLVWSFDHFSPTAKRVLASEKPWHRARLLLMHRALGDYSVAQYVSLPKDGGVLKRLSAHAIALMPRKLANFVVSVACALWFRRLRLLRGDLKSSPYYWMR